MGKYDSDQEKQELIQIGQVSSVNPATGTARVAFDALDNMVSAEFPVINNASGRVRMNYMPDIGDHVLICRLPNGESDGFIMGTYNTTGNPPMKTDGSLIISSENGQTYLEVTQDGINVLGDLRIAGSLGVDGNISCNGLDVEGNTSITGNLTVGGNIRNDGNMTTGGTHTDSVGRHS